MGYFKKQFKVSMFNLEYQNGSDFYISCLQKNRAVFPLLFVRAIVFLGCLGILLASIIMTTMTLSFDLWCIYLTHWGVFMITLTSGFGFIVSCRMFLYGHIDSTLPWYVKVYWLLYNISIPLAIFITIYYYSFLSAMEEDFAINPVLDIFIHAVNSALMVVLMLTSRQPCRILHFIYPLGFGLMYLAFSAIHYATGGTDPFGNNYIYPTLDWALGWQTFGMAMASGVALIFVHLFVVLITACRNTLTRRYYSDSHSMAVLNTP